MGYNHENNFIQTLNAVFSIITFSGTKMNRSEVIGPGFNNYLYTTIWR